MIRFIEDPSQRQGIARQILESLVRWFEVEESREDYIRKAANWPFWAAFCDEKPVGFLCVNKTGADTAEIAVIGVLEEYQGRGYGQKLFNAAREYMIRQGYSFIQVKTVAYGMYEDYDKTNDFYRSLGFKEFELFEDYWDKANPCQVYVMSLKDAVNTIDARHSYRGRFSDESVRRKDLEIIAQAGMKAPSGCNKQTTELIIVDDKETLDKIKSLIDPPVAQSAPAMIVVLSRRINAYRDKCFATQDYAAAIENMLLTIVELGYRSCWYEGHITDDDRICDRISQALGVPEEYNVVCILPVGKPIDEMHAPVKKPFQERISFNRFGKEET